MADLSVKIKDLELKNPVMTASGTFGYGLEFADFVPLEEIGGIIVKGTTLEPREGNDYPRMAETPQGMLNCVGLQNKGVEYFCSHIYPQIKDIDTNMIVNVSGHSPESYAECAARINELDKIPAIELNISCPNVKDGGMAFGVTCEGAASVVKAVRKVYKKTLIVKLSPNVTSIADIARAVEAEGADSVSLINTADGRRYHRRRTCVAFAFVRQRRRNSNDYTDCFRICYAYQQKVAYGLFRRCRKTRKKGCGYRQGETRSAQGRNGSVQT